MAGTFEVFCDCPCPTYGTGSSVLLQAQVMGTEMLFTIAHVFFYQMISEAKHITLELSHNFSSVLERLGKIQMGE